MNWNEKFKFMHANVTLTNRDFSELVNQICRTAAVANGRDCFLFDNNVRFPHLEFEELTSMIRGAAQSVVWSFMMWKMSLNAACAYSAS